MRLLMMKLPSRDVLEVLTGHLGAQALVSRIKSSQQALNRVLQPQHVLARRWFAGEKYGEFTCL